MEFTIEDLNKAITAITRAQAKASKEIGKCLLMSLYFSIVKADAGAANALINCLRKSTKQQAIVDLLEEHGNLAYTKVGKKPGFEFFDAKREWTPEVVEDLRNICSDWESYKAPKEEQEVDVAAAVERIVKRAESAKKNQKSVKGEALLAKLTSLLAKYNAEQMDAALKA